MTESAMMAKPSDSFADVKTEAGKAVTPVAY